MRRNLKKEYIMNTFPNIILFPSICFNLLHLPWYHWDLLLLLKAATATQSDKLEKLRCSVPISSGIPAPTFLANKLRRSLPTTFPANKLQRSLPTSSDVPFQYGSSDNEKAIHKGLKRRFTLVFKRRLQTISKFSRCNRPFQLCCWLLLRRLEKGYVYA
jgi:hypothetical protein